MKRIRKLDHLLGRLEERIFVDLGVTVPLRFSAGGDGDRAARVASDRSGWIPVTSDLVWGEPDGYFWFGGTVEIPPSAAGCRLVARVEAAFGRVMGRSDPQCLIRLDGRVVQGADANHREVLLAERAEPGRRIDVLVEAGTIEGRRQLGFALRLMRHDLDVEETYFDLRVPLDVARLLAEDDPRRSFILNRLNDAVDAIDLRPGDPERFRASLAAARAAAEPIYRTADFEAKPTIVATGHTHIDVAWLWRVRETRQKMARSMATALSLMDEFPDYRFMYNQGVLLDHLADDYPELFGRLKSRVADGRFEIEGALWLEPDVNISGGEALVRQILHGVAYHRTTFGVTPKILWLPDTFGYSAALPQLMRLSGLDTFVTHKLSWNDTNRMPDESLFWQGTDGSRVAAYFLTTQPYTSTSIGTTYCPDLKPTHVMGAWRRHGQQHLSEELFLVYGFGDGGGGPTRGMLHNIRRMERGIPGCPRVEHAPMRPFFERLLARMEADPERYPTWVGELYLEFHRGTLTSVAKVKRDNRLAEIALRELELLAVLAAGRGHPYPADDLHRLWRIVMLNQFHDILPGSSIGPVYADSADDFARFFRDAEALRDRLVAALGPGARVLNATSRVRHGLAEVPDGVAAGAAQTVVAADGGTRSVVRLGAVPPLALSPIAEVPPEGAVAAAVDRLENERLVVRFDERGRIVSLVDKASGREAITPGGLANRLVAFRDMPAEFDAWDIDADFEDQSYEIDACVAAEVVETGPLRAAVRFEWRYERSRIVMVVSLEAGARQVEIDSFVDWHEHNTLVKAAFPLAVRTDAVAAEIQFGHVLRPTHRNTSWDRARFECSMQRWVDVSEPGFGVALLNDCKYGYDAKGTEVRLTLLRSPTWPWPDADQGEHRFRTAILVHDGDRDAVHAAAEDFNLPLRIVGDGEGGGAVAVPFRVEGAGVVVEAVKRAEAGDGIVVRLWESGGRRRGAVLHLDPSISAVARVDLLEENARPLPVADGRVALTLAPFEIVTLRLD